MLPFNGIFKAIWMQPGSLTLADIEQVGFLFFFLFIEPKSVKQKQLQIWN